MELYPALNLNKHPKDCKNLSLVDARGMKLSNDLNVLDNEDSLINIDKISIALAQYYNNSNYNIVGIIPCSVEIVLIVSKGTTYSDIFRYVEETETLHIAYTNYKYNGGKIKGTYTYNVEGSLIIAIAEYAPTNINPNFKIPLKTINLGNLEDITIANDRAILDDYLSIAPKVTIPKIIALDYVPGSAYKGWYNMFIRFKINSVDYTQWFNFGYPIYIDELESRQIIRYCFDQYINQLINPNFLYHKDGYKEGYCVGCSDSFSGDNDICSETFKIDINTSELEYNTYQLGVICSSKAYTKAFKTSDLTTSNYKIFTFDIKQLIEASAQEFIIDNYNYYNIQNIINYNNRLYISNYKENSPNNDDIPTIVVGGDNIIDKIDVKLTTSSLYFRDNFLTQIIGTAYDSTNTTQYEIKNNYGEYLTFATFFNVPNDTIFRLVGTDVNDNTILQEFTASNIIIMNKTGIFPDDIKIVATNNNNTYTFELSVNYTNTMSNTTGRIICSDMTIAEPIEYIQPNNSFNTRKKASTLIPGEVYNFFIHFVDKYGHATNGYKLTNKSKRILSSSEPIECVPVPIFLENSTVYAIFDINSTINPDNDYSTTRFFMTRNEDGTFSNEFSNTEYYIDLFKKQYNNILNNPSLKDYKLYQVFNNGFAEDRTYIFGKHTNNDGDILFKVPEDTNTSLYYTTLFNIEISNVTIPNGYVGYFISHEKFEPTKRVTGFLTRNDFRTQSKVIKYFGGQNYIIAQVPNANLYNSDKMYFYSSKFDINDSIKLDYNIMTVIGKNCFETKEIIPSDYWQRNKYVKMPYDYNKPIITRNNTFRKIYTMPEFKLCPADSMEHNRAGLGTALQIKDSYNLFNSVRYDFTVPEEDIVTYVVELANISNNLYMSKNKTLIRLSEIYYETTTRTITNGYNGRITYDGVLIYENSGLMFNEADFVARKLRGDNNRFYPANTTDHGNHSYAANVPFANYLQFLVYDDYFYESKCFSNSPAKYIYPIKGLDSEDTELKSYYPGTMVEAKNSIDLFQNKRGSADLFTPKVYGNYRNDIVNVSTFDKTIRRSNIIQDESRVNAWRIFPVEGYKNIAENKGKITNLIGIGFYLLAHTEHSLFMFNKDNSLKTDDKDIQLLQPDIFEVSYQEVFTSDLGYGGLQDSLASVVDQFGYIFYNESFNHLYKFDNGKLTVIDQDFNLWLSKYTPKNVRIANDKFNNRLLLKFEFNIEDKHPVTGAITTIPRIEVFSFNYLTNKLISGHYYSFDRGFNTETKLYLTAYDNYDSNICRKLYEFDRSNRYGSIDYDMLNLNYLDKAKANTYGHYFDSSISIILNVNYDTIKFLEYIKYKLRKVSKNHIYDYNYLPIEQQTTPYAGDYVRAYGEFCDTGVININVAETNKYGNYKKPWFELGHWNFNYLRNMINSIPTVKSYEITRIYGNYIIIQFIFDNIDGELIEFEGIEPIITKQRL